MSFDYSGEFEGKVALVTGTSGIARGAAFRLARAGASVVALGIDPAANLELAKLAADEQVQLSVSTADVSNADQVDAAVDKLAQQFGGLDIIINSAAIHPYGTVVTTDSLVFSHCLAVNVGSIHLTAHFGIPLMEKRKGGSIVNVASVQGHACQQNVAAYVASKGAIHALTRAMAIDHASAQIRVNSVSPGSVRTPLLAQAALTFDGPGADVEDVFRRFGAAHPIGRIGEVDEVAELIAYLASDRSKFCTGGDFLIDGGLKAGLGVK
ncbi:MAG: SDR family oxidoreductase [Phyllobacterium sp.]|uniref:SDR family NAD(P)-dependent oxidoreductase n=1 Tax=Phyllobacterium sp. TaxID=1871046 RepID=UPI0030F19155